MTLTAYVFRCDSITPDASALTFASVTLSLYRRVNGVLASAPSGSVTVYAEAAGFTVGSLYAIDLSPVT